MSPFDRRQILGTAFGASLVLLTGQTRAFAHGSLARDADTWLSDADALTAALRGETLSIEQWREGLDELFSQIALEDLLAAIDFETLRARAGYADLGVATASVSTGGERLSFYPKIFAVNEGRSIIPHGHQNMVCLLYTSPSPRD